MRTWLPAAVLLLAMPAGADTSSPFRQQRERELALVQHLHRHLRSPRDGISLAADKRDLERSRQPDDQRPGASLPEAGTPLMDRLSVLADVWYARLVDRSSFSRMRPETLPALMAAEQAVAAELAQADRRDKDPFLPDMRRELQALIALAGSRGDIPESAIDTALVTADQASLGVTAPVAYPGGPSTSPEATAGVGAVRPATEGAIGPTPYTAPPGIVNYGPGSAPTTTTSACQVLREAAGVSSSASAMLRAAECWRGLQPWPGWAAEMLEALDWAVIDARLDRDCDTLQTIADILRESGREMAAAGQPGDPATLASRADADRKQFRWLGVCRSSSP